MMARRVCDVILRSASFAAEGSTQSAGKCIDPSLRSGWQDGGLAGATRPLRIVSIFFFRPSGTSSSTFQPPSAEALG